MVPLELYELPPETAEFDPPVTAIKTGGEGLGGTTSVSAGSSYNSNGTSVTGTYGTLTLGADGTYTYVADQDAADALDAGDTCLLYTSDAADE